MKLIKVKIQNYRKHKTLELEFGDKTTLIGGPNETGKSTIAEAIHRVLFFKAKGNTAQYKQMESLYGGIPEVELIFAIGKDTYTLKKKFGSNGNTQLSTPNQAALNGTAAEEKLGELLSFSHSQNHSSACNEWAHLWVWQGSAGTNLDTMANQYQDRLISCLRNQGVEIIMQSDKDMVLSQKLNEQVRSIFNTNGSAKAGSKLKESQNKVESTDFTYKQVFEKVKQREDQSKRFAQLDSDIKEQEKQLKNLYEEFLKLNDKLKELDDLKAKLSIEEVSFSDKEVQLKEIINKRDVFVALQKEVAELMSKTTPRINALKEKETSLQFLKEELNSIEKKKDQWLEQLDSEQIYLNYLTAKNELNKCKLNLAKLSESKKRYLELEHVGSRLKEKLDNLPKVDQNLLDTWAELEAELSKAQAVLESISTGIEILENGEEIVVGEAHYNRSDRFNLITESVLQVGNNSKIKISPGGGQDLKHTRTTYKQKEVDLKTFLADTGFTSRLEALEIFERRKLLHDELLQHKTKIENNPIKIVNDDFDRSSKEVEVLENKVNAFAKKLTSEKREVQTENLEQLVDKQVQKLENINGQIKETNILISSKKTKCEILEKEFQADSKNLEFDKNLIQENKIKVKVLEEQEGDEANRNKQIDQLQKQAKQQEEVILVLQKDIEDLEPVELTMSHKMCKDAIDSKNTTKSEAILELRELKGRLTFDGNEDINADLEVAHSQYETAVFRHAAVELEADALQLLDNLFKEEKEQLGKEYTAPFAKKIGAYLKSLFGNEVNVKMNIDTSGKFNGISLYRSQQNEFGQLDFDLLSGGAKEQVAAAVRLAMAEVLADNYGGTLPIIFDDAFAYSDGERIEGVQNMLYKATEKGLQVIILSCNPKDYAGLGATEVSVS